MEVLVLLMSISLVLGDPSVFSEENIAKNGIQLSSIVHAIASNPRLSVSSECSKSLNALLLRHTDAFLQMADSWAKFPYSGAFYRGTHIDYGDYDECIGIEVQDDSTRIIGKYCAWGFTLPMVAPGNTSTYYLLSYCIPNQCTHEDINEAINISLFNTNYCTTKDTDSKLDTGAIVAIVIFLIFGVMMVASTSYDVYLFYSQKKSHHPLLLAFSVLSNGKKLLATTKTNRAGEQILCFNGMKFISMWWIISGHGFIAWYLGPVDNQADRVAWQTARYAKYITSAHISVDTFFYISGFLTSYLYFKQAISKASIPVQIKAVPSMVLHRYLRLTPANAAAFLGAVYLFKYVQDGPFFSYGIHTGLIEQCTQYWWTYFLYIQNYYNFHYGVSLCIPTTWYLSADFQLFLVSPLIIIPLTILYRRSLKLVMGCLLVLNLLFMGLPIWTKLQWRDYDPTFQEYDFHSKLISYFLGVMVGIYMRHEKNKSYKIPKIINLGMWFLALSTMLAVLIYRNEAQIINTYESRTFAYSFTRPMWCLALSWITFACVKGYGGIVNWFLSSSFMQIGAKLTYCIYIVHGFVIAQYALGFRNRLHYSDWNAFYINCGYFIISMLVATVWTLAFESPMMIIERFIFGGGKKAPTPKLKTEEAASPNA